MTYAEAAMIMMAGEGGGGGEAQTFQLPESVTLEPISGLPFNYIVTETYSDHTRKIGLQIYNYGRYDECISFMYFYDSGEIPSNPYNYDHYISFSSFYTN